PDSPHPRGPAPTVPRRRSRASSRADPRARVAVSTGTTAPLTNAPRRLRRRRLRVQREVEGARQRVTGESDDAQRIAESGEHLPVVVPEIGAAPLGRLPREELVVVGEPRPQLML